MNLIYSMGVMALLCFSFCSCGEDDSVSCVECSSDTTVPFEVCRESNGNASVNGEDTGTDYDVYLNDLEDAGASCGR